MSLPEAARSPLRIAVDASIETGGPYAVLIGAGLVARLREPLREAGPAHRWAIISDDRVAALYGRSIAASLERDGQRADLFEFPAGEAHKTRETWARLTDEMIGRGLGRDCAVLALGGGVAGDLAAFVAATYMRGVPCVQVPTTLLAMIDAAIGGKSGVDVPAGKNLVGAIRQPKLVLIDPEVLSTLPQPDYLAGFAEAIKHGAIADADYLSRIEADASALLARDAGALTELVRASVMIKAKFVAADALEAGPRAALNFGHTIGHALEKSTDYAMPHGFAVAAGMVVEARLGESLGVTTPGTADRIAAALRRFALPTELPADVAARALVDATQVDKKARAARVRYTLLERAGAVARAADHAWTHAVDAGHLLRLLQPH